MSGSGRPKSKFYQELGFDLVKQNNKYIAMCNVCEKVLHNTAAARLKGHR